MSPAAHDERALVSERLAKAYPQAHIRSVDAAIGGQPSKLGVFRMDRDVLPHEPDLTFVEFAVNDGNSADTQETMEGIVRKLKSARPQAAVVIVIIGAGWDYGCAARDEHLELARHYGLPCVDVAGAVKERIAAGLDTREILTDGCHPNDDGYRLYADIILAELERLRVEEGLSAAGARRPYPREPLTANGYEAAAMLEISKLPDLGGWTRARPSVTGTWFDHQPSRWHSSAVSPAEEGGVLRTTLECSGLGLYYEIRGGGGTVTLSADGETVLEADAHNPLWEARVQYAFKMLGERKSRRLDLRATAAEEAGLPNTKAAYLLYTR